MSGETISNQSDQILRERQIAERMAHVIAELTQGVLRRNPREALFIDFVTAGREFLQITAEGHRVITGNNHDPFDAKIVDIAYALLRTPAPEIPSHITSEAVIATVKQNHVASLLTGDGTSFSNNPVALDQAEQFRVRFQGWYEGIMDQARSGEQRPQAPLITDAFGGPKELMTPAIATNKNLPDHARTPAHDTSTATTTPPPTPKEPTQTRVVTKPAARREVISNSDETTVTLPSGEAIRITPRLGQILQRFYDHFSTEEVKKGNGYARLIDILDPEQTLNQTERDELLKRTYIILQRGRLNDSILSSSRKRGFRLSISVEDLQQILLSEKGSNVAIAKLYANEEEFTIAWSARRVLSPERDHEPSSWREQVRLLELSTDQALIALNDMLDQPHHYRKVGKSTIRFPQTSDQQLSREELVCSALEFFGIGPDELDFLFGQRGIVFDARDMENTSTLGVALRKLEDSARDRAKKLAFQIKTKFIEALYSDGEQGIIDFDRIHFSEIFVKLEHYLDSLGVKKK